MNALAQVQITNISCSEDNRKQCWNLSCLIRFTTYEFLLNHGLEGCIRWKGVMKSAKFDCNRILCILSPGVLFGLPISYWLTVLNRIRCVNNCSWKRNANEIFSATDRLMTTKKFRHRVRKTLLGFHDLFLLPWFSSISSIHCRGSTFTRNFFLIFVHNQFRV